MRGTLAQHPRLTGFLLALFDGDGRLIAQTAPVPVHLGSMEVSSNLNCPLPVTAAVVHYVLRCLMPAQTPARVGTFETICSRLNGEPLPVRAALQVPPGRVLEPCQHRRRRTEWAEPFALLIYCAIA